MKQLLPDNRALLMILVVVTAFFSVSMVEAEQLDDTDERKQAIESCGEHFTDQGFYLTTVENTQNQTNWICKGDETGQLVLPKLR